MNSCTGLRDVYKFVGLELLKYGEKNAPRGMETKELLNVSFEVTDPRSRLVYHPQRKFSLPYAIVESMLLVNPTNKLKYYAHFNKNIEQFSDDGETLHGSYGHRIAKKLPIIIDILKNDPASRQAVIPIFNPDDVGYPTKGMPCTLDLHFMIRDGALNLHVHMRSNDIIWGLPYDMYMFTTLQEVVANELNVPLGTYFHNADSLHVYEKHYDLLQAMVDGCWNYNAHATMPVSTFNASTCSDWIKTSNVYLDFVDDIDSIRSPDKLSKVTFRNNYMELLADEERARRGISGPYKSIPNNIWYAPFMKKSGVNELC